MCQSTIGQNHYHNYFVSISSFKVNLLLINQIDANPLVKANNKVDRRHLIVLTQILNKM
jgi:hypothetical protein